MGKNILLTGGTGKLGQNLAIQFAKEGGKVVVTSRSIERAKNLALLHSNIIPYQCNFLEISEIKDLKNFIELNFKSLDVIINNAAVDIDENFLFTRDEDFEKLMMINTFGPYYICKYLIHLMIGQGRGKIVNISSGLSLRTVPGATEYSMSKAALDSLTRSLAVEFGKYGIYANGINISCMRGKLTRVNQVIEARSMNEDDYDDWKVPRERIPVERRGTFREFVNVALFLASEESDYLNGVNIPVDGGINARL